MVPVLGIQPDYGISFVYYPVILRYHVTGLILSYIIIGSLETKGKICTLFYYMQFSKWNCWKITATLNKVKYAKEDYLFDIYERKLKAFFKPKHGYTTKSEASAPDYIRMSQ